MSTATALEFDVRTHNGMITITNPATGGHRTFRIRTQAQDDRFKPGARLVGLLTGPDNTRDYQNFGHFDGGELKLWRKKNTSEYRKFADLLLYPEKWMSIGVKYNIEGRCRRCNRLLTTPDSVSSGIGPKCAEIIGL